MNKTIFDSSLECFYGSIILCNISHQRYVSSIMIGKLKQFENHSEKWEWFQWSISRECFLMLDINTNKILNSKQYSWFLIFNLIYSLIFSFFCPHKREICMDFIKKRRKSNRDKNNIHTCRSIKSTAFRELDWILDLETKIRRLRFEFFFGTKHLLKRWILRPLQEICLT